MRPRSVFVLAALLTLSSALLAGSCDVQTKKVKLVDLDPKLKQHQGGKWDGLQKQKIRYAVKTTKEVDEWSKASAVCYASLVQAEHVAKLASKDLETLKKQPNSKAKNDAEKNVKLAQDILEKAAESAPELIKKGKNLAANYQDLIKDPTKAPQVMTALKDSIENLAAVGERAPDTIKRLGNLSKKLAD